MPDNYHADVIVVGSGPGGAAITRDLTRQGKRVLLLESGVDHRRQRYYGTYLGALIYSQRMSLLFTKEGLNIIRPMMVGGATSMYCGSSAPPPLWLKERYGVDIDQEVSETIEELEIAPLPEELRGKASTRIAMAAQALGYEWYPLPKFIRPHVVQKLDCGAKCMLGCSCGAKWNAAEYVDEAVRSGAELKTQAKVRKVLVEDGHVVGVWGRIGARPFTAKAPVVVLAAGGIGTPRILQASGMNQAGQGMAMDTTVMVYGFIKESGIGNEPPMTWAYENDEVGYMLSTLLDPWLLFPLINATKGLKYPFYWPRWNRTLGVMIKLKDEISGGVFPDGSISKPMTKNDTSRLGAAEEVCHKILVEAGADRSSIFTSPLRGTHPSATVRIGEMLDENLETEIEGLYVCDASAFPEALDRPTVLTIIGMARRLAKHLTQ
jgi:choline dehydrogenase-like flavoprotein